MDHMQSHPANNEATIILQLRDVHCICCADTVLEALRANPHITQAHPDWPNDTVRVSYHASMLDDREIERLIETTGCKCEPDVLRSPHHRREQEHAGRTGVQHVAHGIDVQPVTMGTKHDRMQYEMQATEAHKY